jgi:hypothetical protein
MAQLQHGTTARDATEPARDAPTSGSAPAHHDAALSFSGSGVLATFQAGVAHFIARRIGPLRDGVQLLGTSGGAIVAVLLGCGYDFSGWVGVADAQIRQVRAAAPGPLGLLHFGGINLAHMARILPPDAHARCSGRVAISTTRLRRRPTWRTLPWRNARLGAFRSREELLGAVALSSHAPGLYGAPGTASSLPRFRGGDVGLDGGLTDNAPLLRCGRCGRCGSGDLLEGGGGGAARTLTVSPIDPTADVHGAPELRWFHVLQLAGAERLQFMFDLGWRRAEAAEGLIRRKLLLGPRGAPPCPRCAERATMRTGSRARWDVPASKL